MKDLPLRYLSDPVRQHARARPDKPAIVFRERVTTYAELDERANRVANGLIRDGLRPQARVAILANNADRFFEIWQGASRANLVLTPLNFRLAPAEIRFILDDAKARVLFVGPEYADLVNEIAPSLQHLDSVKILSGEREGWQRYAQWLELQDATDPRRETSDTDTVIQYYSSGTTGFPKGVETSHRNMMRHTPIWLEENGNWDQTDVSLVPMPLFHVAGSAYGNAALVVGGTNIVMPQVDPHAIIEAIERHGVTRMCVVPAVIQAMLMDPLCERTDFSRVKKILYGASPMPTELIKRAVSVMGPCLEQTYGTTETGGGFTRLSAEDHEREDKLQSCGKPMRYVAVRVVDENGKECDTGVVGEILVRGECVMKGYWGAPEATQSAIRDGWLHTGDAGYFDTDGYLYVHDRIHDLIVTGGENVYPAEVENALRAHPDVAEAAVFGVPDERWGEAVKAVIVAAPSAEPDAQEILAFCRARIAHYKCPKSVDIVASIPRNATGKILKKDLRKPFWTGYKREVN